MLHKLNFRDQLIEDELELGHTKLFAFRFCDSQWIKSDDYYVESFNKGYRRTISKEVLLSLAKIVEP